MLRKICKSLKKGRLFSSLQQNQREIDVFFTSTGACLEILFHNNEKKLFYVNEKFTFQILKDMIKMEYPSYQIELNFSNQKLEEDSSLIEFLNSNQAGTVKLYIEDNVYSLKNSGSMIVNQQILNQWNQTQYKSDSILNLYQKCVNDGVSQSQAGVLSYYSRMVQKEISKLPKDKKLTKSEIQDIFKKSLAVFSEPINQEIQILQHKLNQLESNIENLQSQKIQIEEQTQKKIKFYQNLLVLISIIHIVSFYYMIFHVEWLGWDIIEPITYTVQQISVLCCIFYYMRHGKVRSYENMQKVFQSKILKKNKPLHEKYDFINSQITIKQKQFYQLENFIENLKEKRYSTNLIQ